jgi:hypothetical protein
LAVVQDRHAAIERIQFLYGCAKPCGGQLDPGRAPQGHVVFTYRDGSPAEYVAVTLDDGAVVASEPAEY